MDTQRDISIDILRAIAFMGLVAAHIKPSDFILQLRNFDVPMMVFLSGVVFSKTSSGNISYPAYVYKRFIRIIIPTWLFLFIYFRGIMHYSIINTISEFDLMTDWYVWIMRVFFIIAIFAPLVKIVLKKISIKSFFVCLFILLAINDYLCHQPWGQGSSKDTNVIILMNLAYLLVFSFGCMAPRLSRKHFIYILILSLLFFLIFGAYQWRKMGFFVSTQFFKYPPQLYYLSYAFILICLLWLFRDKIFATATKWHLSRTLQFVGSHTMWMYFWHIIALYYFDNCRSSLFLYILVIIVSTAAMYIQHKLVTKCSKHVSPVTSKYARIIFDG